MSLTTVVERHNFSHYPPVIGGHVRRACDACPVHTCRACTSWTRVYTIVYTIDYGYTIMWLKMQKRLKKGSNRSFARERYSERGWLETEHYRGTSKEGTWRQYREEVLDAIVQTLVVCRDARHKGLVWTTDVFQWKRKGLHTGLASLYRAECWYDCGLRTRPCPPVSTLFHSCWLLWQKHST